MVVDMEKLTAPFPKEAIREREGARGMMLKYLDTATVIRRLNDATENEWEFNVTHWQWNPDQLVVVGALTIPGHGTRAGTGVQAITARGGEDLAKGAASDALKKAATLFGVGLELYPDVTQDAPRPHGTASLPPGSGAARLDAKPERNAPRPAQQQERVAPPQIGKYGDHAPKGNSTRMTDVNDYLHANGFTGGNVGECIKELQQWVHETFHTDDKIIPTGPVNAEKPNYGPGTLPADIFNYAFHFISQCDVDEGATAAVTAAAGGVHALDDDQVPF